MSTAAVTRLTHTDIKKLYTSGFKPKNDLKIGLEYERLPIIDIVNTAAEYSGDSGVCAFLKVFADNENWDYICDNNEIIGLQQGHDTITLEPGCQIEFSLEPQKDILQIENKVNLLNLQMSSILNKFGISFINYGVSPISTYKSINLIPKRRYDIMAKYLWGILSDVMMRETAGIQGAFDFTCEEDAMKKFKIANMISPFMTAMFANSPIRGGVDTGYKSFRALSWLNTDNDRCGFFSNFKDDFDIDDYINYVLTTPMLFITRNGDNIIFSGDKSFDKYLEFGHAGFYAELQDYQLQANLCFPEVRLRNFIEVRNHDCNGGKLPYAMLAIYKGILYSPGAITMIEELLNGVTAEEYNELRYNVPKSALNSKLRGKLLNNYAKEIINIAEYGLNEVNKDEISYLDYIKEYTFSGITPADVILKNWYGAWNKKIDKLINYVMN